MLNAGLHAIDTGAGTSRQRRREGVACVSDRATAYDAWLSEEQENGGPGSRGAWWKLGRLMRGGGFRDEMERRQRRRGKGLSVFEWSA